MESHENLIPRSRSIPAAPNCTLPSTRDGLSLVRPLLDFPIQPSNVATQCVSDLKPIQHTPLRLSSARDPILNVTTHRIAATCHVVQLVSRGTAEKNSKMNITEITRETLRGLKGLVVIVETVKSDAEADGLKVDDIQTEVETRLKEGGVCVLPHEVWRATVGRPWLYVSVNTMKYLFSYFFSIDVQLKQDVTLPRQPSIRTSSATWEMGSIGFVAIPELPEKIRESIAAYIDSFISDYTAVNGDRGDTQ